MKLIVLFSAIAYAAAFHVPLRDCGSTSKLVFIDVDPCTASPCTLKHGQNYTITVDFTAAADVKDVGVKIYGVVAGVPVPFPFDHPDACGDPNSGLKCPLVKGTEYTYRATLPIKSEYPAIKLYVKWVLEDNDDSSIMICDEIPVAVVNSNHVEKGVRRIHWEGPCQILCW